MCTGVEVALLAGSAVSAYSALSAQAPSTPAVVTSNPVADQTAIDTAAAQEAQAATLEKRRQARANSLLSSYSGGDLTDTTTAGATATPKLTLGA